MAISITAGEEISLNVDGALLRMKIEDASKGDVFSAKILGVEGDSAYRPEQVCEFSRALLAG